VRAFVIGGTGLVGRAVARRLVVAGWQVDVLGRDRAHLPPDLAENGVRFHAGERDDPGVLAGAFGPGADLLVDCVCFTGGQASALLPLARHANSTVLLSSKAVYVDADGRHSNSDQPPRYDGPITEAQPTLAPSGEHPHDSRLGYGPNKVAAERTLLDSGEPVTVLRPSKIHGEGARPPREWVFVKRALDRRGTVLLAHGGRGVDHPSAAANIAALVETVAHRPGRRVLNAADPDAPNGRQIAATVADHLGHHWDEVLLDDDADPSLGWHPWDRPHPVVLDTTAATELGYRPVGDYAQTVGSVLDWLVETAARRGATLLPDGYDDGYFGGRFDYAAEDRYLQHRRPGAHRLRDQQR
jgi:nucleoside-diphosphate-sugar epimerase